MNRAFALPISAAVLGALLALGVSALERAEHRHVQVVVPSPEVEIAEVIDIQREIEREIAEVRETELRVKDEVLRSVLRDVESELRIALENADHELTDAEREQIREAMEQLDAQLPLNLGLTELLEGITKEDGSAHKDAVVVDVLRDVPAAPEAPAGGSSGS